MTLKMEVKRGSFAELWRYRELLWFLAWRDITVRYKQTVFGVAGNLLEQLERLPDAAGRYQDLVRADFPIERVPFVLERLGARRGVHRLPP